MAPVPEDSAARSDPDPVGERAGDVDGGAGGGDVRVRIRWALVVSALVAALALLFAQTSGYAATFGVTLALAFVVAWGWPLLTGSFTPTATTVVLAVAALAIVLATRRDDLLWVPAA